MIGKLYKRTLSVLMTKPFRLWGISLLSVLLVAVAEVGFAGVPAVAWGIACLLEASMAMIYLNSYRTGLNPKCAYLFSSFKKDRLWHVVGGMAWEALWIFLWALIPVVGIIFAIIRIYEYRFTPYILMTRPEIPATEAIKVSKQETMGYKSKMFWADVLVFLIVFAIAFILGLLTAIPYIGLLFFVIVVLFTIAVAVLAELFFGLLHAAFYAEIKSSQANAQAAEKAFAAEEAAEEEAFNGDSLPEETAAEAPAEEPAGEAEEPAGEAEEPAGEAEEPAEPETKSEPETE